MPNEECPFNRPPNAGSDGRRSATPDESTTAAMSAWQTPRTSAPVNPNDLIVLHPTSPPIQGEYALSRNAPSLRPQPVPVPTFGGQGHSGHPRTSPKRDCTGRQTPETIEDGVEDASDGLAESMIVCPGSGDSSRSTPSPKRPLRGKTKNLSPPLRGPMTAPPWDLSLRDPQFVLGQYRAVFPHDVPYMGNPIQQPNPSPYPQQLNDADLFGGESAREGGDTTDVQTQRGREEGEDGWDMCDDVEEMPKARSRM